jgi:hypothetical protein
MKFFSKNSTQEEDGGVNFLNRACFRVNNLIFSIQGMLEMNKNRHISPQLALIHLFTLLWGFPISGIDSRWNWTKKLSCFSTPNTQNRFFRQNTSFLNCSPKNNTGNKFPVPKNPRNTLFSSSELNTAKIEFFVKNKFFQKIRFSQC